uniref:Lipoyl-binding domain-containing protein n=1 Tax=Globisporangium ultimum (strain ATCC 200006 / CBS 805.95 / DAOM BR144) TaxID=431595 RepID=K3XCB9_GLOUD
MFKLVAARAALVRSGRSLLRTSHAPPLISASGNRFLSNASAPPDVSDPAVKPVLPPHIKFRMPDLDFEHISGGAGGVTVSKWHIGEGNEVKDGAPMCEIDTPDLTFVLEAGDEGYIAKIFVQEGAAHVAPGQPLAVIVPEESDIEPFLDALKANPKAIEGYVDPAEAEITSSSAASSSASSSSASQPSTMDGGSGSDVLRMLSKLQKEGHFADEKQLKVLKSLARKNNEQLLITYKGSFPNEAFDELSFDKDFFVENALELADEALALKEN